MEKPDIINEHPVILREIGNEKRVLVIWEHLVCGRYMHRAIWIDQARFLKNRQGSIKIAWNRKYLKR